MSLYSRAFWEAAEYVSVLIIIAGVVGEYIADFVLRDVTKKERVGKISTLILVVGLAMELPAMWRINEISGKQITQLGLDSENAQAAAESAKADAKRSESEIARTNQRAAEAKAQVAEAARRAAEAGVRAAKANERAGALELEAATQQEKAAKAEIALMELRQRMQPRHLTPQQTQFLMQTLATVPSPKGGISVMCVVNDPEAQALAIEFDQVFQRVGWVITTHGSGSYFPSPAGILITAHAPMREAEVLKRAVESIGFFPVSLAMNGGLPEGGIEFLVGTKP